MMPCVGALLNHLCSYYFDNNRKMKLISYIYTFFIAFVQHLIEFVIMTTDLLSNIHTYFSIVITVMILNVWIDRLGKQCRYRSDCNAPLGAV